MLARATHRLPHEILEKYLEDPARMGLDTALYSLYPPPSPADNPRPGEKGYLANAASRAVAARDGLATPEQLAAAWDKSRRKTA